MTEAAERPAWRFIPAELGAPVAGTTCGLCGAEQDVIGWLDPVTPLVLPDGDAPPPRILVGKPCAASWEAGQVFTERTLAASRRARLP